MRLLNDKEFQDLLYKKSIDWMLSKIKDGDKVLEIGAKYGVHTKAITDKRNVDYRIYDLIDERKDCKDLPFEIVDVSKYTFPALDDCFDVILASNVLEHLHNVPHFLLECHRVLKKGGLLLLDYPNFSNIFMHLLFFKNNVPNRLGGHIDDGLHINFLPYKSLIQFTEHHFDLDELSGDLTMDQIFVRKMSKDQKFLVFNNSSRHLCHNIFVSLSKK